MGKNNNLHDFLVDVADAIREKKGTSEPINPQEFSNEIKNLPSGASPFAVDFGEEISSGNAAYINALQEDIDYYNQIQEERRLYAEGKGGRSDDEIRADLDFKHKIAWWPSGMETKGVVKEFENYFRLRSVKDYKMVGYASNVFNRCSSLVDVGLIWNDVTLTFTFQYCTSLRKFVYDIPKLKVIQNTFVGCYSLETVEITSAKLTNIIQGFQQCYSLKRVRLTMDVDNPTSTNNAFSNCTSLEDVEINLPLSTSFEWSPRLSHRSIAYILKHASDNITITFASAAYAGFEDSMESLEAMTYAEILAAANSRGITIALK